MTTVFAILPFVISFFTGFLLLNSFYPKKENESFLFILPLSLLSGLGLSSFLTFFSFVFFNQYSRAFILLIHCALLGFLFTLNKRRYAKNKELFFRFQKLSTSDYIFIALFFLLLIPAWMQASYYPFGGWDAWSTWNFKAKFLFLGGAEWKNIFDDLLWRSSPQYPLFLPLINVWGWSFLAKPAVQAPLLITLIFTLAPCSLLYSALRKFTQPVWAIAASMLLLTNSLYIKLATSQYADIIIGSYILAAVVCLIFAKKEENIALSILAGMFLGFLSFTKSEGFISAFIILALGVPFIWWKNASLHKRKIVSSFLISTVAAMIPAFLFMAFLAPKNLTFINGLSSTTHPSTWERLQFIFAFFFFELKSPKWGWIWILLGVGVLLSFKKCLSKETIIIPAFLLIYTTMIVFYYFVNTQFEIGWWLQVTLHRLIFALLPLTTFWIFSSAGKK